MLLKSRATEDLIEVTDVDALVNPVQESVKGRDQAGQEEQNTESFKKTDLIFPSGEPLPRCWVDANYKGNGL
ncbi:MAG: acetyltransferase [Gemmatimonadaceae bacterium]|nr:acetyltransferase [Gloeobacterales cyanobacterium ES-bin-141]